MTFTDETLKRLKKSLEAFPQTVTPDIGLNKDQFLALLARLEAIERFVAHSGMMIEAEDHPYYIAWRKAAWK